MKTAELNKEQFLYAMDEMEDILIGKTETEAASLMPSFYPDLYPQQDWSLQTQQAFLQAWSQWGSEIVGWVKATGEKQDAHLLWRTSNPSTESYRIYRWAGSDIPAGCIRSDIHVWDDMKAAHECLGVVHDDGNIIYDLP